MTTPLPEAGSNTRLDCKTDAGEVLPAPRDAIVLPAIVQRDLHGQGIHHGVRFKVEALKRANLFEGRFTIDDEVLPRDNRVGGGDGRRPIAENCWATPAEALMYAVEAAHYEIEGLRPSFTSGPSPGM